MQSSMDYTCTTFYENDVHSNSVANRRAVVNQEPLMNQGVIANQESSANQGVMVNHVIGSRSRPNRRVMMNQELANQGVIANRGSLANQGLGSRSRFNGRVMMNQRNMAKQGTNANQRINANQRSSANQGAMANEGDMANQGVISNQGLVTRSRPNRGVMMNQRAMMNQEPLANQGVTVNQGSSVNQRVIANQSLGSRSRSNGRVMINQRTIVNQGIIANQRATANEGNMANQGTIANQRLGTLSRPNIMMNQRAMRSHEIIANQRSSANQGAMANRGYMANQGGLVNRRLMSSQGPMVNQEVSANQETMANQIIMANQGFMMTPGAMVNQVPLSNQSSARHYANERSTNSIDTTQSGKSKRSRRQRRSNMLISINNSNDEPIDTQQGSMSYYDRDFREAPNSWNGETKIHRPESFRYKSSAAVQSSLYPCSSHDKMNSNYDLLNPQQDFMSCYNRDFLENSNSWTGETNIHREESYRDKVSTAVRSNLNRSPPHDKMNSIYYPINFQQDFMSYDRNFREGSNSWNGETTIHRAESSRDKSSTAVQSSLDPCPPHEKMNSSYDPINNQQDFMSCYDHDFRKGQNSSKGEATKHCAESSRDKSSTFIRSGLDVCPPQNVMAFGDNGDFSEGLSSRNRDFGLHQNEISCYPATSAAAVRSGHVSYSPKNVKNSYNDFDLTKEPNSKTEEFDIHRVESSGYLEKSATAAQRGLEPYSPTDKMSSYKDHDNKYTSITNQYFINTEHSFTHSPYLNRQESRNNRFNLTFNEPNSGLQQETNENPFFPGVMNIPLKTGDRVMNRNKEQQQEKKLEGTLTNSNSYSRDTETHSKEEDTDLQMKLDAETQFTSWRYLSEDCNQVDGQDVEKTI